MTISIYSPEGLTDPNAEAGVVPTRLERLSGSRIGVLDNGKAGANLLLGHLAERLARRIRGEEKGLFRKGSAATPCESDLADRIADDVDILLTGTAD